MNLNPFAYSDALAISARLQRTLDDVAPAEVHLFAYLACILSLYKGWPAGNWGYSFARTKTGYPYSVEVDDALKVLNQVGCITNHLDFFTVTDQGEAELEFAMSMTRQTSRLPFIHGACASALALPVGLVRSALLEEPDIRRAILLSSSRMLLDETGVALLHEHFEALSEAVGPTSDSVVVPAMVWLNYLAEMQRDRAAETNGL